MTLKAKPKKSRSAVKKEADHKRQIGQFLGNEPGPVMIFIGGIHGNEPAGVIALKKVLKSLKQINPDFAGDMYALTGNLKALSAGQRYVDQDLNRIWMPDRLVALSHYEEPDLAGVHEKKERDELLNEIDRIIGEAGDRPVYFIDLHTTSAESMSFITIGDTLRNRHFALQFPIPVVLGIEEQLKGTVLNYINELGHIAIGFEGGQHEAPSSIENHIAFVWLTLHNAGCITGEEVDNFHYFYENFSKTNLDTRGIFELRFRYGIDEDESFRMEPGFVNFQRIRKDQVLARNQDGKIRAREGGRIFMPLYQAQGDDGYFIVRQIRPFWLNVSERLRKWRIYKWLHLLPGVRKHPDDPHSLVVNTALARWYVMEFFHLIGYRRERKTGKWLVVTKRKYDFHAPKKNEH